MDEVEPALDDVNLHRFLRLIDGFAAASQVLIVTHQKRTMEIAGMMYGVSLTTDGTTKVDLPADGGAAQGARGAGSPEAERERADAAVAVTQTSADEEPVTRSRYRRACRRANRPLAWARCTPH